MAQQQLSRRHPAFADNSSKHNVGNNQHTTTSLISEELSRFTHGTRKTVHEEQQQFHAEFEVFATALIGPGWPRGFRSPKPWHDAIAIGPSSNMIDPSLRVRRAIHANDPLLTTRILRSQPHLLHNPDTSASGLSNSNLHLAASLGHVDVCRVLVALRHEIPCPALNENHQTALMLAAGAGSVETVLFLAESDPSCVPRRDARGRDAVMEASRGGHDTVVQILLTWDPEGAGGAVTRADEDGNTSLHFASSNGNLLVLRTLLAAGADPARRNGWDWTAISYSATVAAEVYLKGLVAETQRKKRAGEMGKKGVRVVGEE